MKYSIIIPAYKEAKIIESSLNKLAAFLNESNLMSQTEVIVVSADSTDNTADLAEALASKFNKITVIKPGAKVGKGRDVRIGVLAAKGEYVLFTDADLATPVHHIPETWAKLDAGADVVTGVRDLKQIHHGYRVPLSIGANWLTRLMVLPGVPDSQCGYKAFTREAAEICFKDLETMGWGFDFEVLVRARQAKLNIVQQPIPDWSDPKLDEGLAGESGITATINTFKELWRVRTRLGRG
jgi:dolichyl-phosphate beta-glucosyltransferase